MIWYSTLSRVLLLFLAQTCLKVRIVERSFWPNTGLWPVFGHQQAGLKSNVFLARYQPGHGCHPCSSLTSTTSKPATEMRCTRRPLSPLWPAAKTRHPP